MLVPEEEPDEGESDEEEPEVDVLPADEPFPLVSFFAAAPSDEPLADDPARLSVR